MITIQHLTHRRDELETRREKAQTNFLLLSGAIDEINGQIDWLSKIENEKNAAQTATSGDVVYLDEGDFKAKTITTP
jgi:hypothetical protein